MIISDKKKAVGLILSGRGGDSSAEVKPEEDYSPDSALKTIAEDLLMALESKSAVGVKDALKAFVSECSVRDEDSEME